MKETPPQQEEIRAQCYAQHGAGTNAKVSRKGREGGRSRGDTWGFPRESLTARHLRSSERSHDTRRTLHASRAGKEKPRRMSALSGNGEGGNQ